MNKINIYESLDRIQTTSREKLSSIDKKEFEYFSAIKKIFSNKNILSIKYSSRQNKNTCKQNIILYFNNRSHQSLVFEKNEDIKTFLLLNNEGEGFKLIDQESPTDKKDFYNNPYDSSLFNVYKISNDYYLILKLNKIKIENIYLSKTGSLQYLKETKILEPDIQTSDICLLIPLEEFINNQISIDINKQLNNPFNPSFNNYTIEED